MHTPAQMSSEDVLSPEAAKGILDLLPQKISHALREYATSIDYPIELVVEMAIAGFLDVDALTFADCRITPPGRLREKIEILELQLAQAKGELDRAN
ncbi:hypothetical protein LEP3755_61880 [Leptolyngbya sp. NIES-3755]|nr:hypothetical protein LEP3755_61880 [Leptolyngbya sp. NIES-3755]